MRERRRTDWIALLALVVACGAFVVSIALTAARIDELQVTTCHVLRGLVYAATSPSPANRAAANAYIARTPLRDCATYPAPAPKATATTPKAAR